MARIRNSFFVDIPPLHAEKGSSIVGEALRSACGNTALIYDRLTGENATTGIDHAGNGGCPLNMPLANQTINAGISAITGTGLDECDIIIVPIYLPANWTTRWTVEVDLVSLVGNPDTPAITNHYSNRVRCVIRNSSWTVVSDTPHQATTSPSEPFRWNLTLTAGALQYLIITTRINNYTANVQNEWLLGWRLFPNVVLTDPSTGQMPNNTNGTGLTAAPAQSTLTPSNWVDFDSTEVEDGGPLNSFVVGNLNIMSSTLYELITGACLPGNSTKQVSQTIDNNRAIFTSEPLLPFPIGAFALGGANAADVALKPTISPMTAAPTTGLLGWSRYPVAHSTTPYTCGEWTFQLPDFDNSPSAFSCYVICQAAGADNLSAWKFRVNTPTGASAAVALSQLGATNYWVCKVVAIPFSPGTVQNVQLQIEHTSNGALTKECLILGCYFDFNT